MNTTPPASSDSNLDVSSELATDSEVFPDEQRIVAALLELEQHVHQEGWDGPPRLFALGRLGELVTAEPELASALGLESDASRSDEQALIPIEQEWGSFDGPLDETLAQIMWPPQVAGAAVTMERVVLPPEVEEEVAAETDPQAQIDLALNHPLRQDMRVAVAVLRDGPHMCAVRVRAGENETVADQSESTDTETTSLDSVMGDPEVLTGPDLVPGLVEALASTFKDELEQAN